MEQTINNYPNKDYAVSGIRLVALTFIVICHFFQYYDIFLAWWFNVGVEIFLIISGFLYGKKQINDPIQFIKKQFIKILIPYYIYICIALIFYLIFQSSYLSINLVLKLFLCCGTISGLGHLWFIPYILLCYLITPLLDKLWLKLKDYSFHKILFILLFTFMIIYLFCELTNCYFSMTKILCYLFGYFTQLLYQKYGKKFLTREAILIIGLAIICNIFQIYVKYFNQDFIDNLFYFNSRFYKFENFAHFLLGGAIFLILYFLLKNTKASFITKWSDKYSYYVYLTHHIYLLGPFSVLALTPYAILNCILAIGLILASSLALKYLSYFIKKPLFNLFGKE